MSFEEQIDEVEKLMDNKEYAIAEEKILGLISSAKIKNIEDNESTYYCFNNYVEILLFINMCSPKKGNTEPDINYTQLYYYLGFINKLQKNYGKALEYLKKSKEWNPVNIIPMFEMADVYKNLGNLERFRAEIEKIHPYIYTSFYMSKYYRELGWYFVERREFDLANALYTHSLAFAESDMAKKELEFIAKQTNKGIRTSTREEVKELFENYNIYAGFNKGLYNIIYNEYQRVKEKKETNVVNYLSKILYDITLDKKYIISQETNNEKTQEKAKEKVEVQEKEQDKVQDENLKEYVLENPKYSAFKFYFPESMGEYYKTGDNIFELKKDNIQKIRVMVSKCKSADDLEESAKKWIETNKASAKMEDSSYRKETINNIPIEVYELKKIEGKNIKIYKIGYVNGYKITISGWKVKGKEEIINKAFEKLTWDENTKIETKKDENKKSNETKEEIKPIVIDCPDCSNKFELKWNIPSSEKTFYCKCPNCGTEIKMENPNYKGT